MPSVSTTMIQTCSKEQWAVAQQYTAGTFDGPSNNVPPNRGQGQQIMLPCTRPLEPDLYLPDVGSRVLGPY